MFIFAVFIKILMQWEAEHKNFATCEISQAAKLIFASLFLSLVVYKADKTLYRHFFIFRDLITAF